MGELITFPSNGGSCTGYLALPEKSNGLGVIVIQEWWGLVGHITDVADRFAQAGFTALAPDLYHGTKTTEPDDAMRLMMGLAMDRASLDIAHRFRDALLLVGLQVLNLKAEFFAVKVEGAIQIRNGDPHVVNPGNT